MAEHFEGETANEVWRLATEALLKKQGRGNVASRNGETTEILHAIFSISNPRERWICCRVPAISPAFALAEVVAIMNGCNDSFVLNNWNSSLPSFQGRYDKYPGAYGQRLRSNFGFDQLERAHDTLKSDPNSRQTVMLIWDPNTDLPKINGKPNNDDIPCNICSLLKVRDNKLYWTQIIRSNDIALGVPYNFVQFTCLQEIMAGWLGVEIGEYLQISDSLHLYNDYNIGIEDRDIILNSDILAVDKDTSHKCFEAIYKNMLLLCSANLSAEEILRYSKIEFMPQPYNNIMAILATYIAFKRKYYDISEQIISKCTNKLYIHLWNDWIKTRK